MEGSLQKSHSIDEAEHTHNLKNEKRNETFKKHANRVSKKG